MVVEFVSLPRPRVCCWEPLGGPVLGAVEAVSQCRGWGCSEEALRTPQQGPCRLHSLHLGPEAVSPREARLEGPARVTAAGAGPTCARVHRLRSAWLGQDRGCQTASHRLPAGKLRSRGSGRSEPLYTHTTGRPAGGPRRRRPCFRKYVRGVPTWERFCPSDPAPFLESVLFRIRWKLSCQCPETSCQHRAWGASECVGLRPQHHCSPDGRVRHVSGCCSWGRGPGIWGRDQGCPRHPLPRRQSSTPPCAQHRGRGLLGRPAGRSLHDVTSLPRAAVS